MTRQASRIHRTVVGLVASMCAVLAAPGAVCHDMDRTTAVVIDTDMGVDDAVALALALQDPKLDISAIVAGEGVADASTAVLAAERMLELFNRSEIPLYASELDSGQPIPACRALAESMLQASLPEAPTGLGRPLSRPPTSPTAARQPCWLLVPCLSSPRRLRNVPS